MCTVGCRTLKVWLKRGALATFGDVDVDGWYAAIYGPNNENETAGWSTIYIIQSLYGSTTRTPLFNGGGMHIECQYVGANLFVLINSFA